MFNTILCIISGFILLLGFNNCSGVDSRNISSESSEITDNGGASGNTGTNSDENNGTGEEEEPGPINEKNFTINDIEYLGAFRLQAGNIGSSTVDYATGTIAYNPDNKSIFIAGHQQHNAVGEFKVPALSKSNKVTDLNVGQNLSPFRNVLSASVTGNPTGVDRVNGMYYENGQLVINAEVWYDATGNNRNTTLIVRDVDNFSSSRVDGYYRMSGRSEAAGYMFKVPSEWRSKLGTDYVTGWSSNASIISRYSVGPSMHRVDLANFLKSGAPTSGTINTEAIMNFPYSSNGSTMLHPDAASYAKGSASSLYNVLSRAVYGFIVPNTSTFAVFGSSGGISGGIGYKITQSDGHLCGGQCSYLSGDNYNYYWLFDVNDILNANNVHDPRPYSYGKLPLPFDNNGQNNLVGGSYDPVENILYLSLYAAGSVGQYDQVPLIVTFKIRN